MTWFAMGQYEALDVLIDDFERLEDVKVFCVLLQSLTYDNHISAKQVDVARRLGMQAANVSRAMKRLVEMGAIFKGSRPGFPYQLNPEFGWKGSAKHHIQALDEHRKKRLKMARITEVLPGELANEKKTSLEPTEKNEE